jgi:hypothetical protein
MTRTRLAPVMLAWVATLGVGAGQSGVPPREAFVGVLDEHPAIEYTTRPRRDRVAVLAAAVARDPSLLTFEPHSGYLRSLLRAFDIPAESQVLVFSKTGVQRAATSPSNPRALYFDRSVVVGHIPNARMLEIAAHDPEQGVIFYTLEQSGATAPALVRRTSCLACHVSASTQEVPGLIARSHVLDAHGEVMPQLGRYTVDHRTPLPQRWGGWFVTGDYPKPPYDGVAHMGNVTVSVHPVSGPATTSNEVFTRWLDSRPETRGYLSAESDVAALMLFDHQTTAINLLTRVNWEARVALAAGAADFSRGPLQELIRELVDYFLFVDEAAPPGRVTPRAGLAAHLARAAPVDRRGRSLAQLDLEHRLLRFPCSYMIYTDAFAALPRQARDAVYRRLWSTLSPTTDDRAYSHLSVADRRDILDILRETLRDLPADLSPR